MYYTYMDVSSNLVSSCFSQGVPDSCHGDVFCEVSVHPDNSQLIIIDIFLNLLFGLRCSESYEFIFGGESASETMNGDLVSASFAIVNSLSMSYINQEIYTLDAEGIRGIAPCFFSFTGQSIVCVCYIRVLPREFKCSGVNHLCYCALLLRY